MSKTDYQLMIEQHILEYISSVDFKHPDLDINEIKKQISTLTNTTPSIRLIWETKQKVNELKKSAGVEDYIEKIELPTELTITLLDESDKPFQLKYIL